jgi:hypothetical protein
MYEPFACSYCVNLLRQVLVDRLGVMQGDYSDAYVNAVLSAMQAVLADNMLHLARASQF